jgi:predicted RNase H-like HicB family nuclease
MELLIEVDREDDGRYIAEDLTRPGVLAYGATMKEAVNAVIDLAQRVIAEEAKANAEV